MCLVGVTVFAGTVGADAAEARPVSRPTDRVVRLQSGAQATLPAAGDKLAVLDAPNGSQLGVTAKTAEVGAVDYATSATDTGVQTIINIADASAPGVYDFGIDVPGGATLVAAANGGARVQRGHEVVATVAAPWAKDATGRALPTHFELVGSTLRQVVDHRGAQYPVQADPSVGFGWGIYVVFDRQEVRDNLWYAAGNGPKLAAMVCVPAAAVSGLGAALCGIYVAGSAQNLLDAFKLANERNQCVEIIHTYGGYPYAWNAIDC